MRNNRGRLQFITAVACGCLLGFCLNGNCHAPTVVEIGHFQKQDLRGSAPAGWQIQPHKGTPSLTVEQDGRQAFLRLSAAGQTAFGVKRSVSVDVRTYPFLRWVWKAHRLPDGGDIRRADRDDQVLQLYAVFPAVGFPGIHKSPTIAYIWDNEAPKGLMIRSPQKFLGYVRYMVLRNKMDGLDIAQKETRNIYEDYKILFADIKNGEPPGPIQAVLLFINTHHTKGAATGSIGDITFSATEK